MNPNNQDPLPPSAPLGFQPREIEDAVRGYNQLIFGLVVYGLLYFWIVNTLSQDETSANATWVWTSLLSLLLTGLPLLITAITNKSILVRRHALQSLGMLILVLAAGKASFLFSLLVLIVLYMLGRAQARAGKYGLGQTRATGQVKNPASPAQTAPAAGSATINAHNQRIIQGLLLNFNSDNPQIRAHARQRLEELGQVETF